MSSDVARTPAQLATELGFSRAQIYAMIDRREIGYVRRPGGHIRILQQHIDTWIANNECPALQPAPASSDATVGVAGTLRMAVAASALTRKTSGQRKPSSTRTSTPKPGATAS
jgi:excisionase family DNA binding protein